MVENFQQTGDSNLGKEILDQSYKLAEAIINKKYKSFGYNDDLLSESHDAIVSAIYAFDAENKTKFLTFCSTCINNRIKNFIKRKGVAFRAEENLNYTTCKSIDRSSEIDIRDSLKELSMSHIHCLMEPNGSRSMQSRAKKKFFKIFKDERR